MRNNLLFGLDKSQGTQRITRKYTNPNRKRQIEISIGQHTSHRIIDVIEYMKEHALHTSV